MLCCLGKALMTQWSRKVTVWPLLYRTNSASSKAPGILYQCGSRWPPSCLWTPSSALTFLSSPVSWRHSKPRSRAAHDPNQNQPGAMLRRWPPCLGNRSPSLTGICILSIQACSLVVGVRGGSQLSLLSVLLSYPWEQLDREPELRWVNVGDEQREMMRKRPLSRMAELASWSASKYGSRRMYE